MMYHGIVPVMTNSTSKKYNHTASFFPESWKQLFQRHKNLSRIGDSIFQLFQSETILSRLFSFFYLRILDQDKNDKAKVMQELICGQNFVKRPIIAYRQMFVVLTIGIQKQPQEMFCKKRCSQKFRKIHRKAPVPEPFF